MDKLAEDISNLDYDTLYKLLGSLSKKLGQDALADEKRGRRKLSYFLADASHLMSEAATEIGSAAIVCKPYNEKIN